MPTTMPSVGYPRLGRLVLLGVLCFLSATLPLLAQSDLGYLQPDRPDQSEGVSILAPKHLQIEGGIGPSTAGAMLETMVRFGLWRDVEVRLEGIFEQVPHRAPALLSLALSSKLALFSGEGWIPAMTLVGYLTHDPSLEKQVVGDLCLALEQGLTDRLSVVSNLATSDGMKSFLVTGELSYNLNERWSCFGEYFGTFARGSLPIHGGDFGLAYAFSPNFMLDLSARRVYHPSGKQDYLALGGAWRL